MFDFGKHKGKTYEDVYQEDPDFIIMWMNFSHRGCDWISDVRAKIKTRLKGLIKQ